MEERLTEQELFDYERLNAKCNQHLMTFVTDFPNVNEQNKECYSDFMYYVKQRANQLHVAFSNRQEYLKTKAWRARKYNSLTHTLEETTKKLNALQEEMKPLEEKITNLREQIAQVKKEEEEAQKWHLLDDYVEHQDWTHRDD